MAYNLKMYIKGTGSILERSFKSKSAACKHRKEVLTGKDSPFSKATLTNTKTAKPRNLFGL